MKIDQFTFRDVEIIQTNLYWEIILDEIKWSFRQSSLSSLPNNISLETNMFTNKKYVFM